MRRCLQCVRPMRILIANDDGYLAPGLAALVQACQGLGDIDVVAPEQQRQRHVQRADAEPAAQRVRSPTGEAQRGFRVVNGTPSDCVHVALTGLLEQRPDLVVSGINNGANMGDDTLYSGTVAAAMEGYLFGIPAIAFSQVDKGWRHLDAAARTARELIEHVLPTLRERSGAVAAQRQHSRIAPMRRSCRVWSRGWAAAMPASR